MEAKDTVITGVETVNDTTFLPPDYISWREHHNLMKAQAEISFKIGKTAGVAESLIPSLKAIDASRKAGAREERDSWLLKTDPEKARDAFTKDIIERARAQAIREVVEWIQYHLPDYEFGDEWHSKLEEWGV